MCVEGAYLKKKIGDFYQMEEEKVVYVLQKDWDPH